MSAGRPSEHARRGMSPLVLKCAAAIVLGTLVVSGAAEYFRRARRQREAVEELDRWRHDLGTKMERELVQAGAVSADTALNALDELRERAGKMAGDGSAADPEVKAVAELLWDMQIQAKPYLALLKRIESEPLLDMTDVKDRAALAARRDTARELQRLNSELAAFMESIDERLRSKLKAAGLDGESKDGFARGFGDSFRQKIAMQRQVRRADETTWRTILAIFDLLDEEWGRWAQRGDGIIFDDREKAARYNKLVAALQKAGDEQLAVQREMARSQQRK